MYQRGNDKIRQYLGKYVLETVDGGVERFAEALERGLGRVVGRHGAIMYPDDSLSDINYPLR